VPVFGATLYILSGDLSKKMISIFAFLFLIMILSHTIDFTHIAASNTASDDVTNQVTHRIFNTNI